MSYNTKFIISAAAVLALTATACHREELRLTPAPASSLVLTAGLPEFETQLTKSGSVTADSLFAYPYWENMTGPSEAVRNNSFADGRYYFLIPSEASGIVFTNISEYAEGIKVTPASAPEILLEFASDTGSCFGHDLIYGSIADISYYLNLYVTLSDNSTQKFFNASPDLLDAFTPGDLRKKHYIVTEYRNDAIYLPLGKYQIEANHEPGNSNSFGQAFRLAEAYLNAAEAAVMNDEEGLARTLIEELRQKRFNEENYTPIDPTLTGDALLERIRLERRLELCFEGHRAIDLYRNGKAIDRRFGGAHCYDVLEPEELDYLYPYYIPYDEVSVSGIPQNEKNPYPNL